MATVRIDIADFINDGYEFPATGGTLEIYCEENTSEIYSIVIALFNNSENVISDVTTEDYTGADVNFDDTIQSWLVSNLPSYEYFTISITVPANETTDTFTGEADIYDANGNLIARPSLLQVAGSSPAPAKRKYITTYGGDGYFELGSITIDSNTIFKFKATPRIAPEGFWLGNWSNWYGIYHPVQSNIQNLLKWYSTGSREGVFYQGQSLADILDHSFEIETSTSYVKVNGTTVSRNAPINQTFTSFHIGNSTNAGQFDARKPVEWEYFQIYQNGVLSLDLVPAFNNNQYCFKDKVTGNYIYGTGTIGGDVTSFSIDIDNITAEYSGISTSVTVTADEELSWTASTNDSWISLTNPSGTGDGGFTVAVAENNNYSNRTGTVIVTSSDGDVLTVTVEQEKKPFLVYDRPIYRSGSLVKKMYRSGELIYLRLNPASEEPEPPTPPEPTYQWVEVTADFDRSLSFTKVRWDFSKSWNDGFFSELPNINCDNKGWTSITGAEWGYAGQYTMNLSVKRCYIRNQSAGNYSLYDMYAISTQVDTNLYEYEYSVPLYWGGVSNSSLYNNGLGLYVYVEVNPTNE